MSAGFREEQTRRMVELLEARPALRGYKLCEVYTHAADTLVLGGLRQALTELEMGQRLPKGWALIALGGYGRRQMSLRSDVDLQLVVPKRADPRPVMERLLRPVMEARIKLGHGVRTVKESLALASEERTYATAVLTSRHLAGDPQVTESIRRPTYRDLAGRKLPWLLEGLAEERAKRVVRLGDTVFVQEPDLKNGLGGLRDAQLVGWLARLTGESVAMRVIFAGDLLLRVRMALHTLLCFKSDRLTFEYQDQVAELLGLAGEEPARTLMQEVQRATRTLDRYAARALATTAARMNPEPRKRIEGQPRFVQVGDQLASADGSPPLSVADVVDALTAVTTTNRRPEADLELGLEMLAQHQGDELTSSGELNRLLLHLLLDSRPGAQRALSVMHATGLLCRAVPEFEPLMGLVQRDLYHVYTVDAHSLRAVDTLRRLARGDLESQMPLATQRMRAVKKRRLLAVAALLHDIGKGYGPGHQARGAEIAVDIARWLGLDPDVLPAMDLLIRHQAHMALIAMRRDLADPRPIRSLARLVGDVETLDLLYLLTLADWSSVGPEAFGAWHQQLLDRLYERTHDALEKPDLFSDPEGIVRERHAALLQAILTDVPEAPGALTEPIDDFVAALPTRYFHATDEAQMVADYRLWLTARGQEDPVVHVDHEPPHHGTVTLVGRNRAGLLADLAGALADSGHGVLSAAIHSLSDGVVLDRFRIGDPHGKLDSARSVERLSERLSAAFSEPVSRMSVSRSGTMLPIAGLPAVQTEVVASNHAATEHTVFDVVAMDCAGLLHYIATYFHAQGLSVDLAFVATEGHRVRDSFYVVDGAGLKLTADQAEWLADALGHALTRFIDQQTPAPPMSPGGGG